MKQQLYILATCILAGCQMNQKFESVDVEMFSDLIQAPQVTILDVRTPEEFQAGHIPGAENMDVQKDDFKEEIQSLDKEKTIAVYCRSGRRSKTAAKILSRAGFSVIELDRGYNEWRMHFAYPVETFRTKSGGNVQIFLIHHGSIALCYEGKWIQIDPVSSFGDQHTDYSFFPKADVILITHEHGDHLQAETIDQLSGDDTKLYLNAASQDQLQRGTALENGEELSLTDGVDMEVWPAYNTTPDREKFHPRGHGNAYLLDIDGLKVFVSGDTENIPEFNDLRKKEIDVAFLSANQPYTMTPEQCIEAAIAIRPKVLIPYHLGQTDVRQIASGLEDTGIEVRSFSPAVDLLQPKLLDSRLIGDEYHFSVQPMGVCSRRIDFVLKGEVIQKVEFTGGCSGNTQGVASLLVGHTIDEAISRLEGILCDTKPTSCPDQLAKSLQLYGRSSQTQ